MFDGQYFAKKYFSEFLRYQLAALVVSILLRLFFFKFPIEDGLKPPLAPLFLCTATRIALNDATDSVVERTLYDKVYFQHELETAMKRQLNKNNVSLADIRRMYAKVSEISTFE